MPSLYRVLVFLGLGVSVLALVAPAQATSGTLVITSSTTLTEDHFGTIHIVADNVTLDGNGFTVHGPTSSGNGLVNVTNVSGVTVKNLMITGSQVNGLYAENGADLRVERNMFIENVNHGVHLHEIVGGAMVANMSRANQGLGFVWTQSRDVLITNNTALENGLHGFSLLDGSNGNTVVGNTSLKNGLTGFLVLDSDDTTATANTAQLNGRRGFIVANAAQTALYNNTANRNAAEGFLLSAAENSTLTGNTSNLNGDPVQLFFAGFALLNGSSGNELRDNSANRNGDVGFVVEASNENTLTGNSANANGRIGFEVRSGSSFNIIEQNAAHNNALVDASDDQSGIGNVWTNNTFGTSQGI
jgi:parallel beta-helix repeat protein